MHFKSYFHCEVLKFLYWVFDHVEKGLIRKLGLISKFMTSTYNHFHKWLFVKYQIFLLSRKKWCPIITYKHGIYELPQVLLNDFRVRILGNSKILEKYLKFIERKPSAQLSCKNENFNNISKKLPKNSN